MTGKELGTMLVEKYPAAEIVIELRYKTGYDAGDIYHSMGLRVSESPKVGAAKVIISADGMTQVGGW